LNIIEFGNFFKNSFYPYLPCSVQDKKATETLDSFETDDILKIRIWKN